MTGLLASETSASTRRAPTALATVFLAAAVSVAGQEARAEPPSLRPLVYVWKVDNHDKAVREPSGSGFLLGPRGDILTARHVAEHNPYQHLEVSIGSKELASVPVVAPPHCDPVLDLCFLRVLEATVMVTGIAADDFYRLRCRPVRSMESLLAYGFLPGKGEPSTPDGKVTTTLVENGLALTSLDLERSMSGGPVFDAENNVIAVVKGGVEQGLQTAIQPIQFAHRDLMVREYNCVSGGQVDERGNPSIEVSGRWRDTRGAEIEILQDDDRFGFNGTVGGVARVGFGVIDGSNISIGFDGPAAATATPYSRPFSSGVCTNRSDRGCTAHQQVCLSPPAGFNFANASVIPGASEGDGRKDCVVASSRPDEICAVAHAESGAGLWRIGMRAFQECSIEASLLPVGGRPGKLDCKGKATTDTILLSCTDRDMVGTDWILQR